MPYQSLVRFASAAYSPPPEPPPPTPTLWTPSNLSSLAAWFDASLLSSLTIAGGTVSQWADVRGTGLNAQQATTTAQPTYVSSFANGMAGVRFDGTSDLMNFSATSMFNGVGYAALFTVYQKTTNIVTDNLFFYSTTSSNSTGLFSLRTVNSDLAVGGRRLGANTFQSVTATGAANTNVVLIGGELEYVNASAFLWINGSLAASTNAFQTAGLSETGTPLLVRIGNNGGGTEAFDGTLGEMVFIAGPTRISTDERQRIEGYLAHKWGLTGLLPGGHPYISSPPNV